MAIYTVHEPPSPTGGRLERAEGLVFIRDGFAWRAALFTPLWFAFRGEWVGLGIYLASLVGLVVLLALLGAQGDWVLLALLALQVMFGFEATELQRWSLERAGWRDVGAVSGPNRETCERRFFDGWLRHEPASVLPGAALPRAEVRKLGANPVQVRLEGWIERLRSHLPTKA